MELNSLLQDMGLVDAFSASLSQSEIEPAGTEPCANGCYQSCQPGCSSTRQTAT